MHPQPVRVVLYANIDPDAANAGTLHVAGLANGFAKNGASVQLVIPRAGPAGEIHKMLGGAIEVRMFPRMRVPGFRTVWSAGTILALPSVARLLSQRPRFLYVREDQSTWLIHALARMMGVRSVGEHNSLVSLDRDPSTAGSLKSALFDFGQRLSCRLASRSYSVTEGIRNELVGRGAEASRISVTGNGSDLVGVTVPPREFCLRQFGLPADRVHIGFFGHLVWWQGCDQLLAAFSAAYRRNGALSLVFAGQGPMAPALRESAAKAGLGDAVRFLGPISYENRAALIGALDVACFPAVADRNVRQGVASLKIRDYAACGRAILAAELPGMEPMIAAKAVLGHRPDDVRDLEEKIVLLAGDEALRRKLGMQAESFAREHFSWTSIAARILADN